MPTPTPDRVLFVSFTLIVTAVTGLHAQQQIETVAPCDEGLDPVQVRYGAHYERCSIDAWGDTDAFTFVADAGTMVRVRAIGYDVNPRVDVVDSAGDAVGGLPSCLTRCLVTKGVRVATRGRYTILFSDYNGDEVGEYSLAVERIPPEVAPTFEYDTTVSDEISPEIDYDFWQLEGVAGARVHVAVNGRTEGFDPHVEVFGPDGERLLDRFCSAGGSETCSVAETIALPATGSYYLAVSRIGYGPAGMYELTVECVSSPSGECGGSAQATEDRPLFATTPGDVNGDEVRDLADAIALLSFLFLGGPPPVPCVSELPTSGQEECFSATGDPLECGDSGQDGALQKGCGLGVRENGDGTATALCTQLMWQQTPPTDLMTWQDALVFCDQLVLERDGTWASKGEAPPAAEVLYDDWRLPNVRELSSVVDFGEHDPAFSTVFDGPAAPYWTSTSVVAAPEQGWVVDFVDGYRFAASKELKLSVRAVRDAK